MTSNFTKHYVAVGPNGRRIGIVASSFAEFLSKSKRKFDIKVCFYFPMRSV